MAKLEAQNTKLQRKWVIGDTYECILSKSPGYIVGNSYTCYKNEDGFPTLLGEDGFEDLCVMLVSGFKRVDK